MSNGHKLELIRREDGGMTLTFTDLSDATINEWREFAMEHLLGVDRRTRNLYDIRAVKEIVEQLDAQVGNGPPGAIEDMPPDGVPALKPGRRQYPGPRPYDERDA